MKIILKAILALFGKMPLNVQYFNAKILTFLMESVIRYRRDDVMVNFGKCLKNYNIWQLPEIRHAFYQHLSEVIVESIWFGASSGKRVRKSHIVEITNPKEIARLYECSPSVVIMSAHSGNWELSGGITRFNYSDKYDTHIREDNYCVVYRALHNKAWDEVMKDNRKAPLDDSKNYPGLLESKLLVRYALTHKSEKKFYNIITDQRPYYESPQNVKVNFMNQECETMSAAAGIAHKLGFAVTYQSMRIQSRGHYTIEYKTITDNAANMEVADIMQEYYRLLQADIEAQPANYLWTHRRWS